MSDIALYNQTTSSQTARNYFLIFCLIHTVAWTLLPLYFRAVLPGDVAEGIAWGTQMQWGYHKHPPLTAWLMAVFSKIGGFAEWHIYLFSQLTALVSFFGIWRLSLYFLPPLQSLMSVLLLEGVVFFNVKTDELTPDTMQTPIWALILLTFYTSLTGKKHWPVLGLFCGLAVLAKYSAILLFGPMLIVLFGSQEGRAHLKTWGPWSTLLVFLLVIAPHVWWASQFGFQAIGYASTSMQQDIPNSFFSWFLNPLDTFVSVLLTLVPLVIMLIPFYKKEKIPVVTSAFQRYWLLIMGLGPLVFALLISGFTGTFVKHRWLTPCYLLTGLIATTYLKPADKQFIPFLKILAIVFISIPLVRFGNMTLKPYFKTVNYNSYYMPMPEIASHVTRLWKEKIGTPLPYIAGENYLTTYISVYSPDRPKPLMDVDFRISPWVKKKDFYRQGAVFIWYEITESGAIPVALKKEFPRLSLYQHQEFTMRTKGPARMLPIGMAILPPESMKETPVLEKKNEHSS